MIPQSVSQVSKQPQGLSSSRPRSIPKIILQVSKRPQERRVIDMIMIHAPDYLYINMTDKECVQYMLGDTKLLEKFPQIIEKFHRLSGPHKADLFRYFFLYKEGGVFMDSDLMLYEKLDNIIGTDYNFVSYRCFPKDDDWIFNGFMAVTPQNPIMYKALHHAYHTPPAVLNSDYFHLVRELYSIVAFYSKEQRVLIFQEVMTECGYAYVRINKQIAFRHFFQEKTIPKSDKGLWWAFCEKQRQG